MQPSHTDWIHFLPKYRGCRILLPLFTRGGDTYLSTGSRLVKLTSSTKTSAYHRVLDPRYNEKRISYSRKVLLKYESKE